MQLYLMLFWRVAPDQPPLEKNKFSEERVLKCYQASPGQKMTQITKTFAYDKFAGRKSGLLHDSTPSPIILYA